MVLGKVDNGWEAVDAYLWYERLCLSAARTGAATAAFDYALDYAKTRKQFGQTIGKFQAISHKLADMKVMLDVSRMLVYRFAWLMSEGKASRQDAAVLKLYTAETYKTVSDLGMQILGGYGYCMEYPMQRFFRDSRVATIGGGTSEIQRNIIAHGLGRQMSYPLEGVRILELGQIIAGTYGSQVLSDLGAEVIKVETPDGDLGRNPSVAPYRGLSGLFLTLNRNKQSIVINLKTEAGPPGLLRSGEGLRRRDRQFPARRARTAADRLRDAEPRSIRASSSVRSPASARKASTRIIRRSTSTSRRSAATWRSPASPAGRRCASAFRSPT